MSGVGGVSGEAENVNPRSAYSITRSIVYLVWILQVLCTLKGFGADFDDLFKVRIVRLTPKPWRAAVAIRATTPKIGTLDLLRSFKFTGLPVLGIVNL